MNVTLTLLAPLNCFPYRVGANEGEVVGYSVYSVGGFVSATVGVLEGALVGDLVGAAVVFEHQWLPNGGRQP